MRGHRLRADTRALTWRPRFLGTEHIPATRLGRHHPRSPRRTAPSSTGWFRGWAGWVGTVERDETVQRIAFQARPVRQSNPLPYEKRDQRGCSCRLLRGRCADLVSVFFDRIAREPPNCFGSVSRWTPSQGEASRAHGWHSRHARRLRTNAVSCHPGKLIARPTRYAALDDERSSTT